MNTIFLILLFVLGPIPGEQMITMDQIKIESVEILPGDQIERDIIDTLAQTFLLSQEEVVKELKNIQPLTDWEGVFVPGKYAIQESYTLNEFLLFMVGKNQQRVKEYTKDDVILASIVEAEALSGKYYKDIADVFLNRIKKGERLQSCVTAEYALGYQRLVLYRKDVEIQSPYNTYVSDGLPPSAICAFSDEALKAVTTPVEDDSLYYFFYDYVDNRPYCYQDFKEFQKEAFAAMKKVQKQGVDIRKKIHKQDLFSEGR